MLLLPVLGLVSPLSAAIGVWGLALVLAAVAVGLAVLVRARARPVAFLLQTLLPALVLVALLAPGAVAILGHAGQAVFSSATYTVLSPAGPSGCRVVTVETSDLSGSSGRVYLVASSGIGTFYAGYGDAEGNLPAPLRDYRLVWNGDQGRITSVSPTPQSTASTGLALSCSLRVTVRLTSRRVGLGGDLRLHVLAFGDVER